MTFRQLDLLIEDSNFEYSEESVAGVVFTPFREAIGLLSPIMKGIKRDRLINILEPSSGSGNLILALIEILIDKNFTPGHVRITSCEIDKEYLAFQKKLILKKFPKWFSSITFHEGSYLEFNPNISFDLVIMNPPWVGYKQMGDKQRNEIRNKFKLKGQFDLLDPFVLKSFELLKAYGKMALFLPDKVLSSHQPSNSIKLIQPKCKSFEHVLLDKDFFKNVQHESTFITLQKGNGILSLQSSVPKKDFLTIGDCFSLFRGFEISGKTSEYIVTNKKDAYDPERIFVSGGEFTENGGLEIKTKKYISKNTPLNFFKPAFSYQGPAIIIRKTGSPVKVTYVESLPHVSQVVFVIIPKNNHTTNKSVLKKLASYLNSEAGQKELSLNSGKMGRSVFPYITISAIKNVVLADKELMPNSKQRAA